MLATVRSQIIEALLTVLLQQHRLCRMCRMCHLGRHRECPGVVLLPDESAGGAPVRTGSPHPRP